MYIYCKNKSKYCTTKKLWAFSKSSCKNISKGHERCSCVSTYPIQVDKKKDDWEKNCGTDHIPFLTLYYEFYFFSLGLILTVRPVSISLGRLLCLSPPGVSMGVLFFWFLYILNFKGKTFIDQKLKWIWKIYHFWSWKWDPLQRNQEDIHQDKANTTWRLIIGTSYLSKGTFLW